MLQLQCISEYIMRNLAERDVQIQSRLIGCDELSRLRSNQCRYENSPGRGYQAPRKHHAHRLFRYFLFSSLDLSSSRCSSVEIEQYLELLISPARICITAMGSILGGTGYKTKFQSNIKSTLVCSMSRLVPGSYVTKFKI